MNTKLIVSVLFSAMTLMLGSTILFNAMGLAHGVTFTPKIETGYNERVRIADPDLTVDEVVTGLEQPTSMAFLGPDDILVLEKDNGMVQRIVDDNMLPEPVLDVPVANTGERGMLGIAIQRISENLGIARGETASNNLCFPVFYVCTAQFGEHHPITYVFLYFTESPGRGSEDINASGEDNVPLGNRLYRYEFLDNKLTNPKLLLDLPAIPGPLHNGGVIKVRDNGDIYIVIGDVRSSGNIQKVVSNTTVSGILRVTQDGKPVPNGGIIGDKYPLNLYYAYGIRNSFGMDFDPVTGNLWDTENGQWYGDEINLVEPGFNSGWRKVQGIWKNSTTIAGDKDLERLLEDFKGKGKYRAPELTWASSVGLTALTFLHSEKYGKEYENDMFVGDFNKGRIYHFSLNENRTGLSLSSQIEDKVVNSESEILNHIFGEDFGRITDIEMNQYDGFLYVLSHEGTIYRIIPREDSLLLHNHIKLTVTVDGKPMIIPANIGIDPKLHKDNSLDIYGPQKSPLHTHTTSGTIHVESKIIADYTLGEFMDVWGLPLNDKLIKVTVDGKPISDYRNHILRDREEIHLILCSENTSLSPNSC